LGLEALRNNLSFSSSIWLQLMEHRPQVYISTAEELQSKFDAKLPHPLKVFPITEAIEAFRYGGRKTHREECPSSMLTTWTSTDR
jgi:hypothetical protein